MRLVQITVPVGMRDAIVSVLEDEGIDYVMTDEVGGHRYAAVVEFPLPSNAVEPVLDGLREAGLPEDAYTIIVDAETVISRRFDRLSERYAEDDEGTDRIARAEVRARARDLVPDRWTYALMVVVSAIIATAGVLLDSAAVVVGSMVIAPLIGPAMATSVGTVLQDTDLFARGTRLQVLGFAVAVVAAAGFAIVVKSVHLVTITPVELVELGQVRERLAPDFLSLAIALGAGVAGAYSLSVGVSSALVGVMIAVALVPPVAVIGIGIAWGLPSVVFGATVLVLVNFASINLAALAVLWYQGYRPEQLFREDEARTDTIRRIGVLVVAILVLSSVLGVVSYSTYRTALVEDAVREDVDAVLSAPPYEALELISVDVRTDGTPILMRAERVVVTVGRPPGEPYPRLLPDLDARINADREMVIEVRFVDVATTAG